MGCESKKWLHIFDFLIQTKALTKSVDLQILKYLVSKKIEIIFALLIMTIDYEYRSHGTLIWSYFCPIKRGMGFNLTIQINVQTVYLVAHCSANDSTLAACHTWLADSFISLFNKFIEGRNEACCSWCLNRKKVPANHRTNHIVS